jgi:DNA-binding CsgD family transcriptional regulator
MLKEFLRVWLDIEESDRERKKILERLESLEEEVSDLKESQISEDRIRGLEKNIRELNPVPIDLTDRERDMLEALMSKEEFSSTSELGDHIGISSNNARSVLNNLDEKLDLDQKKKGRKKLYRLSEEEKQKILGN